MKKLLELVKRTKCSFAISINEHKDIYQDAEIYMNDIIYMDEDFEKEEDMKIIKKMVELDNIIIIQFYPDTPVGCYIIYHYDLEMAINEAYKILFK